MTDEARRLLTEEERVRIQAARVRGGVCAICGRELGADEPVWIQRLALRAEHGRAMTWWVPAGVECAAPAFRRATIEKQPEPCGTCGRGIYYEVETRPRRVALCSRACSRRHQVTRAREARRS